MSDRRSELEQAIVDVPGDVDAWLVYADWLQDRGEPHGDLIPMFAEAEADEVDDLADAWAEDLLGPFAEGEALEAVASFTWQMGFWRAATLREAPGHDVTQVLEALLEHPSARLLHELVLGMPGDDEREWQESIDALVGCGPLPYLRKLTIGPLDAEPEQLAWVTIGSLDELWAVIPGLEELTVHGCGIELGRVHASHLRTLRLLPAGLGREPVERLTHAELPELRHLELQIGADAHGLEVAGPDLRELVHHARLPALFHLALTGCEFGDELPGILAGSPLLRQLRRLDLSGGAMTDVGANTLVDHAEAFAHLRNLDLRHNLLFDLDDLIDQVPGAQVHPQREEDEWAYGDIRE